MDLIRQIFNINTDDEFNDLSLKIFHFQYKNNVVYRQYVNHLGIKPDEIKTIDAIPFLPISFFKSHKIVSFQKPVAKIFSSSGTSNTGNSKHFVYNLCMYEESFTKAFELFYGKADDYTILALLPSYLEREGSSLVYMADKLIASAQSESGFHLHDLKILTSQLKSLIQQNKKVILLGVSYALLDLAEMMNFEFPELIVMETGGMKGRRKEMVKEELHQVLKNGFGVEKIHSEYGMTELLSQAYSKGDGIYQCPPWMKIKIRDINDPFCLLGDNKSGGINVIDLANIYSCSFIETSDLGRTNDNGSFEIIGRFDNSDVRGCNLMVAY